MFCFYSRAVALFVMGYMHGNHFVLDVATASRACSGGVVRRARGAQHTILAHRFNMCECNEFYTVLRGIHACTYNSFGVCSNADGVGTVVNSRSDPLIIGRR
jgi:hypothetical protein